MTVRQKKIDTNLVHDQVYISKTVTLTDSASISQASLHHKLPIRHLVTPTGYPLCWCYYKRNPVDSSASHFLRILISHACSAKTVNIPLCAIVDSIQHCFRCNRFTGWPPGTEERQIMYGVNESKIHQHLQPPLMYLFSQTHQRHSGLTLTRQQMF